MARDFGPLLGAHVDDPGIALESSGGLLLLDMIIMSLSIISMLIFTCADDNSGKRRKRIDDATSGCSNIECINCGCCPCGGGGGCGGGEGGGGGGGGTSGGRWWLWRRWRWWLWRRWLLNKRKNDNSSLISISPFFFFFEKYKKAS
jgi:hypothetical protein